MIKCFRKLKQLSPILVIILILATISPVMLAEEEDTITEVEDKLVDISDEERAILESLFVQAQEIEELQREMDSLTAEIDIMKDEISNMENMIENETESYNEKLDILEQVLVSYQRMGPSSYIDIILDSDSVTNLLERINTLRDLTRNTGELLESIDDLKEKLVDEKKNLDEKLAEMNKKERELDETINKAQQKVEELESQLNSLKDDREYYQERLNSMMSMMNELVVLMTDITEEFLNIIEEGDLPEDAVKYRVSKEGVSGSIDEDVFNQVIAQNPNLPEIILNFHDGKVEMEFPEDNITLVGPFVVLDEHTIQLQVEEGSFYNMLLTKETVDEFFKEGNLCLDLKPLIGRNTLKNVETYEGYVEVTVRINIK